VELCWRQRRYRFIYAAQTWRQLAAVFGEQEARALFGLTNVLVMFGGSKDGAFNQEISDLVGQTRVSRTSAACPAFRVTPLALACSSADGASPTTIPPASVQAAAGAAPSSTNPEQAATPTKRLETALANWEVQAHRTLAARPDPADLVRVARVQALITSTTTILTEAAAQKGNIDSDMLQRLTPALEASQMAWNRMARRWGELTSPASRTDPPLVGAASEVRAAIAATATNQAGWATPDQLASRLDLPNIVKTLHLSMVASVEIAYVVRDTAADHPGLRQSPETVET
jgi:hypothetical protein